MKLRDIAIAVVWIVVLTGALSNGIKMGHAHNPPGTVSPFPPVEFAYVALPLFFLLSSIGVFLMRHRLFARGWIGYLVDWKWGAGTYQEYFERLRPTALMMLATLIIGVVGLASTYANEQNWYAYFGSAFALTCGLGLLVAYVLSWRFPPRLY
jgi:hypothetical protein